MKHIIFLIAVAICAPVFCLYSCSKNNESVQGQQGSTSISVEDMTGHGATPEARMLAIKNEINSLDERGEYKIAYELINDCLVHHYSLDNLKYAIEHAEKHLSALQSHNVLTQKSAFILPKGRSNWEIVKDYFKIQVASNVAEYLIPGGGIIGIGGYWKALSDADKANYQCAVEQVFTLAEKEKANEIVAQYDILRISLKKYLDILTKSYPAGEAYEIKQDYFNTRDRGEALKKNLIDARCNYISYQIISPALAEVSKEYYLATFKWLEFDDKQIIKDSITLLTHSFHNEWLFASTEEVRMQYCEMVRTLKDGIGKAEWEELKTVTTLLDSNDPSKPRGADAWWRQ